MIAFIRGEVIYRDLTWALVLTSGVGYQIFLPSTIAAPVGAEVRFFCSHQVREDSQHLYGFVTFAERSLFELLLSVSGVGPKSALAIVGSNTPPRIEQAILTGDPTLFEAISGIGRKVAAKIIVELKTKIGGVGTLLPADQGVDADLITTLEGLGYRRQELGSALRELPADLTDLQAKVRWMLKRVANRST